MRGFNPFQVWSQVPIGSRTVKTIRSKVTGTIAFTNGGSDAPTATIADTTGSVTTYTILSVLGQSTSNNAANAVGAHLVETNSTTLTATRPAANNQSVITISYQRLETYGA